MEVNIDRLNLVLDPLVRAYRDHRYPFNKDWARSPHIKENLPKNLSLGSREHALFLFCLCYHMRGGIDSETAIKALAKLYESYEHLFMPETAIQEGAENTTNLLRKYGLGFNSAEIGKFWIENFKFLKIHWNSNPLNLFDGVSTYEDACLRIRNKKIKAKNRIENKNAGFFGFQEKMVSMLIYFFADSGLIKTFHFPPPVDFHVLRTMFGHKILILKEGQKYNYEKSTLDLVRQLLADYCLKNSVTPLELCEAMWILSRVFCSRHPGNTSIVGDYRARKTGISQAQVTWSTAQTNVYFKTCGVCPIETTCMFNIPSAYYYITGSILNRGRREKPPQKFIVFD